MYGVLGFSLCGPIGGLWLEQMFGVEIKNFKKKAPTPAALQ